jgi:hypothetical protein
MTANAASAGEMPKRSWRELANPTTLEPVNGANYYEFQLPNGSSAHLVVAYIKGNKWRVRPFISEKTSQTSTVGQAQSASAAINGGYFNLSDGMSASYVSIEGKLKADPRENHALMNNSKLQSFLPQILNRSEIRILKKNQKELKYDISIARHNDPLPPKTELVDALQAGPRLLPTLDDEDEAFLRKQSDGTIADSIGCKKAAARTAFGITADGYIMFLTIADKAHDKESTGVTLAQLAELLKHLGCREAIKLDGGSSTSMYVKLSGDSGGQGKVVCAKSPETMVKTVLLLSPQ